MIRWLKEMLLLSILRPKATISPQMQCLAKTCLGVGFLGTRRKKLEHVFPLRRTNVRRACAVQSRPEG